MFGVTSISKVNHWYEKRYVGRFSQILSEKIKIIWVDVWEIERYSHLCILYIVLLIDIELECGDSLVFVTSNICLREKISVVDENNEITGVVYETSRIGITVTIIIIQNSDTFIQCIDLAFFKSHFSILGISRTSIMWFIISKIQVSKVVSHNVMFCFERRSS